MCLRVRSCCFLVIYLIVGSCAVGADLSSSCILPVFERKGFRKASLVGRSFHVVLGSSSAFYIASWASKDALEPRGTGLLGRDRTTARVRDRTTTSV